MLSEIEKTFIIIYLSSKRTLLHCDFLRSLLVFFKQNIALSTSCFVTFALHLLHSES